MHLEQNKKNAVAYYQMAYDCQPRKVVEQYVGNEYIQATTVSSGEILCLQMYLPAK